MSKFLNYLAPAIGGTAVMLGGAYFWAGQGNDGSGTVSHGIVSQAEAQPAPVPVAETGPAEPETAVVEVASLSREGGFGLGRAALPEEVQAWDIDIRPDGMGLPEGEGDVLTGEDAYIEKCAVCHGDFGEAVGRWPQLAGGYGTLTHDDPIKTIGTYWPYLSTVWDYVNRAMPFGEAQSLTPDEVYAITAYLLYLNDIVDDEFTLSQANFTDVVMPNADGFYHDDRAETELARFSEEVCMENCKPSVEITMHAAMLDVTPGTETRQQEATEAEPAEAAPAASEDAAEAPQAEEVTQAEEVSTDAAPDPQLVEAGKAVFRKCQACHQVGEGATSRTGPILNDIMGRQAGTMPDFRYSPAMTEAGQDGLVWSDEALADFLADPRGYLQGNRMTFAGLRSDDEIAAIIAFLRSHAD